MEVEKALNNTLNNLESNLTEASESGDKIKVTLLRNSESTRQVIQDLGTRAIPATQKQFEALDTIQGYRRKRVLHCK